MRFRRGGRKEDPNGSLTLYYASDVHGSERCWRKFLGAAKFYGTRTLVMGGDLTGKAIVPIERRADGSFETTFLGERHAGSGEPALGELQDAVRYNGMYPWVGSSEEIERHRDDDAARDALFERVMLEELRRWMALADERLPAQGVDALVMAGNDDPWSCDAVIEDARHVRACDDRVERVGEHEMISCSYANPTPWHSPRELDEDALYARVDRLAAQVEEPAGAIFNLHVPPYDSGLDRARQIDLETLSVVHQGGQPVEIPVGSRAVRELIERYQPLLSLHGHIHESRGATRIGRTLAVNSGSEYNSGRIHGVVVSLSREAVSSHQFVVG